MAALPRALDIVAAVLVVHNLEQIKAGCSAALPHLLSLGVTQWLIASLVVSNLYLCCLLVNLKNQLDLPGSKISVPGRIAARVTSISLSMRRLHEELCLNVSIYTLAATRKARPVIFWLANFAPSTRLFLRKRAQGLLLVTHIICQLSIWSARLCLERFSIRALAVLEWLSQVDWRPRPLSRAIFRHISTFLRLLWEDLGSPEADEESAVAALLTFGLSFLPIILATMEAQGVVKSTMVRVLVGLAIHVAYDGLPRHLCAFVVGQVCELFMVHAKGTRPTAGQTMCFKYAMMLAVGLDRLQDSPVSWRRGLEFACLLGSVLGLYSGYMVTFAWASMHTEV